MTKQRTALIAVSSAGVLSIFIWTMCGVLYFSRGKSVAVPKTVSVDAPAVTATPPPEQDVLAAQTNSSPSMENSAESQSESAATPEPAPVEKAPSEQPFVELLDGKYPFSKLSFETFDAISDPRRGRLILADRVGKKLHLFPIDRIGRSDVPTQTLDLEGTPVDFKLHRFDGKDHLVVITQATNTISVFDCESLKLIRSSNLSTTVPNKLWVIDGSPRVIIGTRPEKFDLKFEDNSSLRGISNAFEFELDRHWIGRTAHAEVFDVDRDGNCLFRPERDALCLGPFPHATTPSGVTRETVSQDRNANNKAYAFIAGRVFFQRSCLGLDFDRKGVLEFSPDAWFSGTQLVAGTLKDSFRIASLLSYETLFECELPDEWLPERKTGPIRPCIIADPDRQQFLMVTRDRVAAFPLSKAGVRPETDLTLTAKIPEAMVRQPLEIEFAGRGQIGSLELVEPLPGMTLAGNNLTWTPRPNQMGTQTIRVANQVGDRRKVTSWEVLVQRYSYELPISVRDFVIPSDGGPVLLIGSKGPQQLAAVTLDLASGRILAESQAYSGDRRFVIGDRFIYHRTRTGTLGVWDRTTLQTVPDLPPLRVSKIVERDKDEWQQVETLFDDAQANQQEIVRLLARRDRNGALNEAWRWNDGPTGFGPLRDGILLYPTTMKPRLLIHPGAFRPSEPNGKNDTDDPEPGYWHPFPGRVSNYKAIRRTQDKPILKGLHPFAPEVLQLEFDEGAVSLKSLTLRDAPSNRVVLKHRLAKDTKNHAQERHLILPTPSAIYVSLSDRMYVVNRDELPPPPPPFHFVPSQESFVLKLGETHTVRYTAKDAARYVLRIGRQKITSEDGEFTFELPNEMLEQFAKSFVYSLDSSIRLRREDREEIIETAFDRHRSSFEAITGRPATEIPVPIRVYVDAQRDDLQTTGMFHDYLVEIPAAAIRDSFDQLRPVEQKN